MISIALFLFISIMILIFMALMGTLMLFALTRNIIIWILMMTFLVIYLGILF